MSGSPRSLGMVMRDLKGVEQIYPEKQGDPKTNCFLHHAER